MTLEQGLGDAFTPELKEAWTAVYGVIQAKFIEGQYNEKGLALRAAAEKKLTAKPKTTNELVTESWAVVKSAFTFEQVGDLFYKNLFTLAPGIEATVFGNTDHTMQPGKLISFLDTGVSLLDQPEKLVPALVKCGERHAAYGQNGNWVEKAHYPVAGQALLMTLEQGLGKAFTPELKEAWTAVYGVIAEKMIEGQYNEKGLKLRANAQKKVDAAAPKKTTLALRAAAEKKLTAKPKTTNELVTESWAVVCKAFTFEQVGDLFYKNLFTLAPGIKETVFGNTDHSMQPKALISFIDTGVSLLNQPDKLVPALVKCGERHAAYGKDGNFVSSAESATPPTARTATGLRRSTTPSPARPSS
eukprot:272121_1